MAMFVWFTLVEVQFPILCGGNAVFMIWLGLATKPTWLGLGKDHELA